MGEVKMLDFFESLGRACVEASIIGIDRRHNKAAQEAFDAGWKAGETFAKHEQLYDMLWSVAMAVTAQWKALRGMKL